MKSLEKQTLVNICEQMAAHPWPDAELNELVDRQMGIITGLQDLLNALEVLRQTDLVALPPANNVQHQ
jgi:hypothetical protein